MHKLTVIHDLHTLCSNSELKIVLSTGQLLANFTFSTRFWPGFAQLCQHISSKPIVPSHCTMWSSVTRLSLPNTAVEIFLLSAAAETFGHLFSMISHAIPPCPSSFQGRETNYSLWCQQHKVTWQSAVKF